MTLFSKLAACFRAGRRLAPLAALAVAALCATPAGAQTNDAPIGLIEGDNISVRGEVHVITENGHSYTALSSGSQVTVRSGRARIQLTAGGEIGICGPARFSLLQAGSSLTLALDYGRVRARLANPADLRIYTPLVQASPIAAMGRADDLSVGLEERGRMCVHASSGALRLEPQFGGESIVVPQGTEATLQDGQLAGISSDAHGCGCDALDVKRETPAPAPPPPNSASRIPLTPQSAPPAPQVAEKPEKKDPTPATPGEQPIWKVYAPPLAYDASVANATNVPKGGVMPPPAPETALLFREVYAEPVIVWRGEVEEPPKEPAPAVAEKTPPPAVDAKPAPPAEKKESFGSRIGNFFRRLFGGKPKQEKPSGESQPAAASAAGANSPRAYIPS